MKKLSVLLLLNIGLAAVACCGPVSGQPDSTRKSWTSGDKMKNFYACVAENSKITSETKAESYCRCFLEKAEHKFPLSSDYEALSKQGSGVLLEVMNEEITECTRLHINSSQDVQSSDLEWTPVAERTFRNHCTEGLKTDAPQLDSERYCSCLTEKMKTRFPDYGAFLRKTFDKHRFAVEIRSETDDCLRQISE